MVTCKQTDRHTHVSCNAVTLVWGSLRLAPIMHKLEEVVDIQSE